MKKLVLIKLGGSVITDKRKEYFARGENISRFAREIKSALKELHVKVIIGHGAGSFAHTPASIYKTKEGFVNNKSLFGMCVTEEAARLLNQIVIKKFISEKVPVFPFSPASFVISDTKVCRKVYFDIIEQALSTGIIPVVYGDVILDKKIDCTIFSTEKIFSILASKLCRKYKISQIYVTDVNGVYDAKKKTIAKITPANFADVKKSILGASTTDVTGGMLHKVEEALTSAKGTGISTQIINGNTPGNLTKAILGKKVVGTRVLPR